MTASASPTSPDSRPEKRQKLNPLVKEETVLQRPEADEEQAHVPEEKVDYISDLPELDQELFKNCEDGSDIAVKDRLSKGANPRAHNKLGQTAMHVWMIRTSKKVNWKPKHFKTAEECINLLVPLPFANDIVNHIDDLYCTPLSLSIMGDVRSWCVVKGLFNPTRPYKVPEVLSKIYIRPSPITEILTEKLKGTLDLKKNGKTIWHYIASIVYSKTNKTIPGYSLEKDTSLLIITLFLIIREFGKVGKMNLNAKDDKGNTGLDILYNRYKIEDLELKSESDFQALVNKLQEAGCRRANQ